MRAKNRAKNPKSKPMKKRERNEKRKLAKIRRIEKQKERLDLEKLRSDSWFLNRSD